ncbi:uncharacterized protein B0I36DRAFT_73213 [Microdochium trichocladiopsis]|uniref:Uncharacterized protein n=1 Tax=Microdochium trichocladiopsis TaxID=1682393 RepID=A0A9P8YHC2_9PEZI|nr:uncharacterized protein B0I36DRAFT_73213 [Microdochium trichocladiopsis]KAH7037958.1 hypothetical protein B0I36DRAFT_73213 [Microdochium trichocladiopsis]
MRAGAGLAQSGAARCYAGYVGATSRGQANQQDRARDPCEDGSEDVESMCVPLRIRGRPSSIDSFPGLKQETRLQHAEQERCADSGKGALGTCLRVLEQLTFLSVPPILEGQPIWHVSDLNKKGKFTPGARKRFHLLCEEPVRASIAERQDSSFFGHVDGIITEPPPNGLTVLIFCWSYILCASLIERQGYRVYYTKHLVQPQAEATSSDLPEFRLPSDASASLERWLCALLAPKMGGGQLHRNAACLPGLSSGRTARAKTDSKRSR